MQTNNKSYYLFQVNGLINRYQNTCEYVKKILVPRTSNQTNYEVFRGGNDNVYLYIKVADIDLKTVKNYINTNKFLQRIQNGASDAANYQSIVKTAWRQTFTGTQQKQNKNNQNNFINQNNIINKNWGFNNKNAMNQGFNNQFGNQQFNNNNIFPNPQFVPQFNNNNIFPNPQFFPQFNNNNISNQQFVAQKKKTLEELQKQKKEDALKNLNPKNCATQHLGDFFDEDTIVEKIKKNQKTIHPLNKNASKEYLNWLSEYIHNMYDVIINCALGITDKVRCWETNNQQITFNEKTTQGFLNRFKATNFLNERHSGIDGSNLIKDANEIMNKLALCSIKIYNGEFNAQDTCRITTVYDELLNYLQINAQAFVDRGALGFGTDRDNPFRKVVNKHAKVKNLKDVILGLIGL